MFTLKNIPIRNKLYLLLIPPTLASLVLAWVLWSEARERTKQTSVVAKVIDVTILNADLATSLTYERNYGNLMFGWIGGDGFPDRNEAEDRRTLDERFRETDALIEKINALIATINLELLTEDLQNGLGNFQNRLGEIPELRRRMMAGDPSFDMGMHWNWYSSTVEQGGNLLTYLSRNTESTDLAKRIEQYEFFLKMNSATLSMTGPIQHIFVHTDFMFTWVRSFGGNYQLRHSHEQSFYGAASETVREAWDGITRNPEYQQLMGIISWVHNRDSLEPPFEIHKDMPELPGKGPNDPALHKYISRLVDDVYADIALQMKTTIEKDLLSFTERYISELRARSNWVLTAVGIMIAFTGVLSFFLIRSIIQPVNRLKDRMDDIAEGEGDLSQQLDITGKDEIALVSDSFNRFLENIRGTIQQVALSNQKLEKASHSLIETTQSMSEISTQTDSNIDFVAQSGERLKNATLEISNSSEIISSSSQEVATAIEELSNSIHEIAKNCADESRVSEDAKNEVQTAQKIIQDLMGNADKINSIVEIINQIAAQTNLLALNATIEAASAGEAGKGFAVVAHEVKELAKQSSDASDNIREQVDEIQKSSQLSFNAIEKIADIMEQVAHYSQTISAAAEEQSSTTNEIARSVSEVSEQVGVLSVRVKETSDSSVEISNLLQGLRDASRMINEEASKVSNQSTELNEIEKDSTQLISRFKL